nr:hypothetical protein [uncultured Microbacterium sp.]
MPPAAGSGPRVAPVLGFVGLGLAVLGTILACIPVTFVIGLVVLFAAFVVSLVGVFKKNAAKWPSIVGLILSIVGGVVGTVVTLVIVAASLAGPIVPVTPTETPSSTATEQPSAPATSEPPGEPSAGRLSPDEIAEGFAVILRSQGMTEFDDDPDFYPCVGRYVYDSELSDDTIRIVLEDGDLEGPEWDAAYEVAVQASDACAP